MRKLFYESPYIRRFTATVLTCAEAKKGYEITLDETAFYPEGGGQPADHGRLGGAAVLDVHEKNGRVLHLTDSPLAPGEKVEGEIDWDRRFRHMQEHSGEHIVSGLIHERFGYDNVGFHMGAEEVTIDFNGLLTWDELMEIERAANEIIWDNREICIEYPDRETLKTIDYRSKKELEGDIRIVTVPGGDVCACCGTHVARTGEIGLVKFLSMIHYKGGVRISLLCGIRALKDYEAKREAVQRISVLLSAKPAKIADSVEKLKSELGVLEGKLSENCRALIECKVSAMQGKKDRLCVIEPAFGNIQLRQYANRLLEENKGEIVLALSGQQEQYLYVLGAKSEDARLLARELGAALNGKGGGSRQMAQGTFFTGKEELAAVLKEKGFCGPE